MDSLDFEKNRIDMDYQQVLQEYQVIFGAKYGLPAAAIITAFSITEGQEFPFVLLLVVALIMYLLMSDYLNEIKRRLATLKGKVTRLEHEVGE